MKRPVWLVRWIAGRSLPEWQPEIGSDDEPSSDFEQHVASALSMLETPAMVSREGIRERLGREFQSQRDLDECRAIAAASGMADA